ncbi:probable leucine-rich repeat receptor-like protein kinase At1g35710 isoform X2 [Vigna angularis]|uniref:probable leucine-rich repeat receptor-like protein kinase At1g35710 isoform X2 n=1 Tax=Phaseolus angularis TaxID=3914 RepID=UPI0022B5D4ED|nr:probable leucine-rich repeat receptor-like protein kinase At1g35710 isoform X2 [Vigna angularis]
MANCIYSLLLIAFYMMGEVSSVIGGSMPSSSINHERQALLHSGWWNDDSNISDHCDWEGISCNEAGSITAIERWKIPSSKELLWIEKFNVTAFPNLVYLRLYGMGLRGTIPKEIGSLTNLTTLVLTNNHLQGSIPPQLGNLTQLKMLSLSQNSLSGLIPCTLGQLINLQFLYLESNKLEGRIPTELGNLTKLQTLHLSRNLFTGSIPHTLGQLENLMYFFFQSNQITGPIPIEFGNLKSLQTLYLSNNSLNGSIPSTLGQLENLVHLYLNYNEIEGQIPEELGNLSKLEILQLSHNRISGLLPPKLLQMDKVFCLHLSSNQLYGSIPLETMKCPHTVDLSFNFFNGSITSRIGCVSDLNLSHNFLVGEISPLLKMSFVLSRLDLSYNNLSGKVHKELASLSYINLSYNSFDFSQDLDSKLEVPDYCFFQEDSLIDDHHMPNFTYCNVLNETNPQSRKNKPIIVLIVLPVIFFSVVILLLILYFSRCIPKKKCEGISTKNGDLFSIWNYDGKIAFEDIIEATEDFDLKYCIGTGAYGCVYRAQLPSGNIVALKKLHCVESQNPSFDKSFRNEVKMLTKIHHKNIVKLHGFCLHNRCKFLVYQYMERGSLFYTLSNEVEAKELNWSKRVNVIKGMAEALSYMHHDCSPPIVHRDVTSSNVLLNSKLGAYISDFGTARLLQPDTSNQTLVVGTRGYIAPVLEW